jgi:18S rRNA (guanine1575-N7)-methyltransferase
MVTQVGSRQRRKLKAKGVKKGGGSRPAKGSREWVLHKKETMRKRGYDNIPTDTKYTARRRRRMAL